MASHDVKKPPWDVRMAPHGFCLYNEIPIPPYCYRLLTHSASWFDAEIKCEEYAPRAHLAYTHISDKDFQETIVLDQSIRLREQAWVGIYMRPWFWRLNECSFERRNMLYSNWNYVGHPPLGGTPDALVIGKDGLWRDYLVTMKHDYFICEKAVVHDYASLWILIVDNDLDVDVYQSYWSVVTKKLI